MAPNYEEEPSGEFSFSCTTPLPLQGKNIDLDPQLASWFHLSLDSPCLRAGLPGADAGILDMDGQPFSNPPSMGATEIHEGLDVGPLSVSIHSDFPRLSVGFASVFRLDVAGQTTRTRWDFGDGTMATNQLEVSHSWSVPGVYQVKLTAWNDATGEAGVTAAQPIAVSRPPTSYVNRASLAPRFPYTTWTTAATNIQDAIDTSDIAGRVVCVTNGVYDTGGVAVWGSMTNRAALRNAVVVRSENGPAFTIIRGAPEAAGLGVGDGAIRCAYVGNDAALEGFTLTNGYTRSAGHTSREQGGGGVWCESRGTVRNCVFVGNRSARDGGGANGGSYENCWFKANRAGDEGGAIDDALVQNCVFVDNVAMRFGNAVSEAHVRHSTLVDKTETQTGISGSSRLQNTILYHQIPGWIQGFELSYCSVRPGSAMYLPSGGSNNITNEPAFVNLAEDNYMLLHTSPCIDAAASLPGLLSEDFNGVPRPLDGNLDSHAASDIGAYEFNPLFFTGIEQLRNLLRLSWHASLPGMKLQSASLLGLHWTDLPITPGVNFLEVPIAPQSKTFRLILPSP